MDRVSCWVQAAEARVEEMKGLVQAAQQALAAALVDCNSAESEERAAAERLRHLSDVVLATEEVSLVKMREELALLQERAADLRSEVGVYRALNAEIKRGTR